MKNIEVITN